MTTDHNPPLIWRPEGMKATEAEEVEKAMGRKLNKAHDEIAQLRAKIKALEAVIEAHKQLEKVNKGGFKRAE